MSEWFGWLRRDRRRKWQRVCGPCSSLAECSRQLGEEARRLGILDRHTCMTTRSYPRDVQAGIAGTHPLATHPLAQGERSGAGAAGPAAKDSERRDAVVERAGGKTMPLTERSTSEFRH